MAKRPIIRGNQSSMNGLYQPLSDENLRFLQVLPGLSSQPISCRLVVHSLQDLSPSYRKFLEQNGSEVALQDSSTITKWTESQISLNQARPDLLKNGAGHQPSPKLHRFTWGDFAALSYVWGDPTRTGEIIVNGQTVKVAANLEGALRRFREEGEFSDRLMLWVDAVCINQEDLSERAHQVKRMHTIYGIAWRVISWLGEAAAWSDEAIQLVRELAQFKEAGRLIEIREALRKNPHYLGRFSWLGLHELMDRPYWYRLWVIQEIVIGGSSVRIKCGSSRIDWRTFCSGIEALQEELWLVKDDCLSWDIQALRAPIPPVWKTTSLHLVYQDLSVMSEASQRNLSLGRSLDLSYSAECADAKDKVYGLLGLMPTSVTQSLQPDYQIPLSEVYVRATKAFIMADENLEALREGNPWGPSGCPSWSVDWLWYGRRRFGRVGRQLWGPTYLWPRERGTYKHVPYCASGETSHRAVFSDNGLRLSCSGFVVDRISGLSARCVNYFEWDVNTMINPHCYRSIYGNHSATTEALFRTLVADRVVSGQRATSRHACIFHLPSTFACGRDQFAKRGWTFLADQEGYYFRWEKFRAAMRGFTLGDCLFDDFFDGEIPTDAQEFDFTEVYSGFDRISHGRRFMTTERGYMGWAPDNLYGLNSEQTREGDLIALVFGCSTPLVIRPYGPYFQVLGEAYVHGLMDGEAIKELRDRKYKEEIFTFC